MVSWKNLDTLAVYKKFMALKGKVNLVEAMSGEEAAERARRNDSVAGRVKNTAISTAVRHAFADSIGIFSIIAGFLGIGAQVLYLKPPTTQNFHCSFLQIHTLVV